jgi:hypothetical protein
MSQDAHPPGPKPSVFLSYASADRAAARALRDTLAAAGLEVWLDEEELAGGEAWDAKIRNQIRTCTYFMPVISATTEKRREGYFRREWRLAVERTLDQADDVMFLVPVVIDDTRDHGARVPEKFLTVQWLRTPGGATTPELEQLAAKLASGDTHQHVDVPPLPAEPETKAERKARKASAPPPPFPKFPPYPEQGHQARFLYNIVLWAGHMTHALWMRLPRTVRVVASVVLVFNLIGMVRGCDRPVWETPVRTSAEQRAREKAAKAEKNGKGRDADGEETIKSLVGAAAHAFQSGRALAVVTFGGADEEAANYAGNVFGETYRKLQKDGGKVGLSPIPLDDDEDDDALARGIKLDSQFVLTGYAHRDAAGQPLLLTVKLYSVKQRVVLWHETYDSTQADAVAIARQIAGAIAPRLAPAPAPPPAPPPAG